MPCRCEETVSKYFAALSNELKIGATNIQIILQNKLAYTTSIY